MTHAAAIERNTIENFILVFDSFLTCLSLPPVKFRLSKTTFLTLLCETPFFVHFLVVFVLFFMLNFHDFSPFYNFEREWKRKIRRRVMCVDYAWKSKKVKIYKYAWERPNFHQ